MDPPLYLDKEPIAHELDMYVKALQSICTSLHPRVQENILNSDSRNKAYYDKRHNKVQEEVTFGDNVLVNIPKVTKLGPKGKGPFIFVRYKTKEKLTTKFVDPTRTIT